MIRSYLYIHVLYCLFLNIRNSNPSPFLSLFTDCDYSIRNLTEPLYITSPHYPLYTTSGTLCKWHLQPDSDFYLTVKDVKVKPSLIGSGNVSGYLNGCLKITGIQNTSVLIDKHVLVRDRDVWINFNTSDADAVGGFLLQILSTKSKYIIKESVKCN